MIVPGKTNEEDAGNCHKVLTYAHHGWGKTHQAKHMKETYGPGLILSGESGLLTLADSAIDFVRFTSWDGEDDIASNTYSVMSLLNYLRSSEFDKSGYKWVMVDSLTEMADILHSHLESTMPDANGFQIWGEYAKKMLGALKLIRDLEVHVVVTALAKESTDDMERTDFWPSIKGQAVAKQLCGIFDHVLCGVRKTSTVKTPGGGETIKVSRWIVTEEVHGWHGKVRDPHAHVPPIMKTGNITDVLEMIRKGPTKSAAKADADKSVTEDDSVEL